MLKGFEFNKRYKVIAKKSKYHQEHELTHEFLATDNENMWLEYDTEVEAQNAAQAIRRYIFENSQPLVALKRGVFVVVARKGDAE